jgi:phosphoribosyl 1,2-cyclic phosphodiesterase
MSAGAKGLRGHILISHTHWDHIQGIPFFAPLFVPGNEWDIYGPKGLGQSLREALAGQMQYTYFPVTLDQCGAKIRYHDLVEGTFDIDDIKVSTQSDTSVLNERITENRSCRVRRIIFGGQPISTTRSIGM